MSEDKKPLKLKIKERTPLKLKIKKKDEGSGTQEATAVGESQPVVTAQTMSIPASGGIRIILKNARIHADKVIIKKS